MRKFWLLFTLIMLLFTACSPALSPTATPLTATDTPTPPPTATHTPQPSPTVKPTRTQPATPTLPPNLDLSCIPADAERVTGRVIGVTDGDTIRVKINGLSFTVRYLGIDTPETKNPVERFGQEAKVRNHELVTGQYVILIRDPNDEDTDRYNRLLRYVIVGDTFVNLALVREGYSHLFISGHSCSPQFFDAWEAARLDQVGLWAPTPEK